MDLFRFKIKCFTGTPKVNIYFSGLGLLNWGRQRICHLHFYEGVFVWLFRITCRTFCDEKKKIQLVWKSYHRLNIISSLVINHPHSDIESTIKWKKRILWCLTKIFGDSAKSPYICQTLEKVINYLREYNSSRSKLIKSKILGNSRHDDNLTRIMKI